MLLGSEVRGCGELVGREITLEEAASPSHLLSLTSKRPTSSQSPRLSAAASSGVSALCPLLCFLLESMFSTFCRRAALRILPGWFSTLSIHDLPHLADFGDDFFTWIVCR